MGKIMTYIINGHTYTLDELTLLSQSLVDLQLKYPTTSLLHLKDVQQEMKLLLEASRLDE